MRTLLVTPTCALAVALVLTGCAASVCRPGDGARAVACRNREAVETMEFGISVAEARSRMASDPVVPPWENPYGAGPTEVANPFDEITLEAKNGDEYLVLRYPVAIFGDGSCPFVNGGVDLAPLIFFEGRLVGWEWDYLESVLDRGLPEQRRFSFGSFCDRSRKAE